MAVTVARSTVSLPEEHGSTPGEEQKMAVLCLGRSILDVLHAVRME